MISKFELPRVTGKTDGFQYDYPFCPYVGLAQNREIQEVNDSQGEFSALFIREMMIEHYGSNGMGECDLTQCAEIVKNIGVCEEEMLPYSLADEPFIPVTNSMMENASNYKVKDYLTFTNWRDAFQAMAIYNSALYIGHLVTSQHYNCRNIGYLDGPTGALDLLGAHAANITGFDLIANEMTYKSSWKGQGDEHGYLTMSLDWMKWKTADFGMTWWSELVIFLDERNTSKIVKLQIGNPEISIDGEVGIMDTQPTIKNGRTFVPIRFISQALDAEISWDPEERKAQIIYGEDVVTLIDGSATTFVNNNIVMLDAPTFIQDGRLMVPLRMLADTFGANTHWDYHSRIITITK